MRFTAATLVLALGMGAATADAQAVRADSQHFVRAPAAARPHASSRSRLSRAEKLRRRMDYLRDYDIASQLRSFTRTVTMGKTMLTSGDMQTSYLVVHRVDSSLPEVHARWDDLVIVRTGTGAVIFGDSLVGSRYRGPGERRGGRFVNQYQVVVHAGDMLRIPAAVPHAFVVGAGQTMDYVVIKSRKQELPIRWYGDEAKPETPAPTFAPKSVSHP